MSKTVYLWLFSYFFTPLEHYGIRAFNSMFEDYTRTDGALDRKPNGLNPFVCVTQPHNITVV